MEKRKYCLFYGLMFLVLSFLFTISSPTKTEAATAQRVKFYTTTGGDLISGMTAAKVRFAMSEKATKVKVYIVNAADTKMYSKSFKVCKAGKTYGFNWLGKKNNGKNAPSGSYRVKIISGSDVDYSEYLTLYKKSDFGGGDGSKSNPYKVSSVKQLSKVGLHNGRYFIQTKNLTLGYGSFPAMCTVDVPFNGVYNGNNKTLSAFTVKNGIFTAIGEKGIVRNLNIKNFISSGANDNLPSGAIAGYNAGKITNCAVSDTVITALQYNHVGGICGINQGSGIINKCSAQTVTATATGYSNNNSGAGGICGTNQGNVIGSSATDVTVSGWQHGFVAGANSGNIINCVSNGTCTNGGGTYGGSITGFNTGSVTACSTTTGLKQVGYGNAAN
ncbi:MAG: hypothetical protein IKE03_10430 [Blautia sp.]|nr:hypothetical protein [Blautia sp.]